MSAAQHMNVAMMTSGGLAPCLSSSVAYLIEFWASALKEGKISGLNIRMYIDGYKGVLTGDSTVIPPEIYDECSCLHELGGSPIGNSRVKVSNIIKVYTICTNNDSNDVPRSIHSTYTISYHNLLHLFFISLVLRPLILFLPYTQHTKRIN